MLSLTRFPERLHHPLGEIDLVERRRLIPAPLDVRPSELDAAHACRSSEYSPLVKRAAIKPQRAGIGTTLLFTVTVVACRDVDRRMGRRRLLLIDRGRPAAAPPSPSRCSAP
jgi:hypothetical protein